MNDPLRRCIACDTTLAKCEWMKRQNPPGICCFDCFHPGEK